MSNYINIVKLIEDNPNTRLSKTYQGQLINKVKDSFTTEQQQLFIASFYCYLNCKTDEFIIDLDNIWEWLGFTRKDNAKRLLEKQFKSEVDFKIVSLRTEENLTGGRPSEKIVMNINTFKKLCLKASTAKANEIHEYYIKLEETLHEIINEESAELRRQLEETKNCLNEKNNMLDQTQKEVQKLTKKYIKPQKEVIDGKNVVYLMTSDEGEKVREYVIGKAIDLSNRQENYNGNKLHDFKVVHYISCNSSKLMDIMESIILCKFGKYRCKAGRDVFMLPETNELELFTNIFDKCFKFFEDVNEEDIIYAKRTGDKMTKEQIKEKNDKYVIENKEELKEKHKEFWDENKEQLSYIGKINYEKNADTIAVKNKKYYEENKEAVIEVNLEYYEENKEDILESRKEHYKNNKEYILEERAKYYKENYKNKIAVQRQKKETCQCGMTVAHSGMKRHKNSQRHSDLMKKLEKKSEIDNEEEFIIVVETKE